MVEVTPPLGTCVLSGTVYEGTGFGWKLIQEPVKEMKCFAVLLLACFGFLYKLQAQKACAYQLNRHYVKTDTVRSCDTCRVNFTIVSGKFLISIHAEDYFEYLKGQKDFYDSIEYARTRGEVLWTSKKDSTRLFKERTLFRKQYELVYNKFRKREILDIKDVPVIKDVYYPYDFFDFLCSQLEYGFAVVKPASAQDTIKSFIYKEIRKKGDGRDLFLTPQGEKILQHSTPDHIRF